MYILLPLSLIAHEKYLKSLFISKYKIAFEGPSI